MKSGIKLFIISLFMFGLSGNIVSANVDPIINPEWIKYNNLCDEDKAHYEAVPEQYIYEFISKNSSNFGSFRALGDSLPEKFNLADIDGKIYSNDINKDQSSLGLCWAFAGLGSLETNLLYKGVNDIDNIMKKCSTSDSTSRYCRLKDDYELNEKYKNKEAEKNVTFSERNIDYIRAKPYDTGIDNSKEIKDAVKERYNPYASKTLKLGAGGTFGEIGIYFMYGIAPKRTLNEWTEYNTRNDTMTLEQIYDSVDTDYVVTSYYNYPMKPSSNIAEWQDGLKKMIMQYGSVYVATKGPEYIYLGKCYHAGTDGKLSVIHDDGNCGTTINGGHAMQIIGWDDNYDYSYCRTEYLKKDLSTKETCESAGYEWLSGKGVWILKNSWGKIHSYLYMTYESSNSSISGVKDIEIKDFDNSYNADIGIIESIDNTGKYSKIYKYTKSNDNEYLSRFSIIFNSQNVNYKISISNDGSNYTLLEEGITSYSGLYSFRLNGYELNTNTVYVKIESDANFYVYDKPTLLTLNKCTYLNNCSNKETISTYTNSPYININDKVIDVRTKTSNIKSGSKLEYKIFDDDNNDVTSNFVIENNYVVTSNNIAKVSFNDDIKTGKYILKTLYNDIEDSYVFNITKNDLIELYARDDIFTSDGSCEIKYRITTKDKVYNYRWGVSDENVATIENGILNIKKSGTITVSLIVSTDYGEYSTSMEVIIYDDKISTPEDFFKIFSTSNGNNTKNYYITNDLDFTDVNFNSINSSVRFEGVINGGYHTIKNATYTKGGYYGSGLVPYLAGIVKNVRIADSTFTNANGNAGAISSYMFNSGKIENVQIVNTKVSGTKYVGGVVGYIYNNNICTNASFDGTVEGNATANDLMVGGIVGYTEFGNISNSYNRGIVTATSSFKGKVYAAGLYNQTYNVFDVIDSYNIGKVSASGSAEGADVQVSGLIPGKVDLIDNSYYLEDDNYTNNNDYSRTKEQLLDKDNYVDWDFIDTWYMNNDYPILRTFPTEVTDINTDLFSNTLNTNSEYIFDLNVEPFGNKNNVQVDNLSQDLITIDDNKIVTKDKEGTAKIRFTIDTYSFTKEYVIKKLIKVSYDNNYTNNDLDITFDINYYKEEIKDGYLEFVYNNTNKKLDSINSLVKISVDENKDINYTLNYCKDGCIEVYSSSITINNIDKDKPTITYDYNKEKKELLINLEDAISGISDNNEYYIAIASNDTVIPSNMFEYVNNNIIKNIEMDYQKTYLWIKNISDNAGNKLCDSDYCVYNLNIPRDKYYVNYYDDDKETLIKKEEYLEDEKINVITYSKEDDMYYYEVIKWDGYKDNMIVKSNIDLYANYRKTSKYIVSEEYLVEDNYIKKILPSNIYNKYMYKDFISKISHSDGFELYEGINKIDNPSYIKTGMIYKNKYNSYKLVLVGDVNGDGYIKMNDIMMIANHLIDNNTLFNEYYYAGDLTGDNKVKMNDLMRLATTMINGGEL